MKKCLSTVRAWIVKFLAWTWPLFLLDLGFEIFAGASQGWARQTLNTISFAWVLLAPVAPISLLLDRERRERLMARICGLREGDEREREISGEAARGTLLLALSLETVLLAMCLINVHVLWKPQAPKNERGFLAVGMGFNSAHHLNALAVSPSDPAPAATEGRFRPGSAAIDWQGFLLAPSAFPVLALLILIQLAAFKAFSIRRYEGAGV